ncbi:hypothetical protein KP509_19G002200 [Ceratopteris richardii]|uniref:Uncharacterized protein n=1 Tax=Ceratopteris richardii TaxID=49495 RepID=A0A8T2SL32_CERRI|nr:hypothetical protein KP509_19G002200 [Ceratopteris richardii]
MCSHGHGRQRCRRSMIVLHALVSHSRCYDSLEIFPSRGGICEVESPDPVKNAGRIGCCSLGAHRSFLHHSQANKRACQIICSCEAIRRSFCFLRLDAYCS